MASVLVIEPYGTASHRSWVDGIVKHSSHDVRTVMLSPQRWRWRFRWGAATVAELIIDCCSDGWRPDVVLISGMVNVAAVVGLARRCIGGAAVITYFHETQLAYPDIDVSGAERPVIEEFAAASAISMAASDVVIFNSQHHRDEARAGLEALFENKDESPPRFEMRVLPICIEIPANRGLGSRSSPPLILWNHRWDHDKGPQDFFKALRAVEDLEWELAVVGQNDRSDPQEFERAHTRFSDRVVAWGFVERAEYERLLSRATIVVSCARHENFGISVLEAVASGAVPLLPNQLSYPEVIESRWHSSVLYDDLATLRCRLREVLLDPVLAQDAVDGLAEATRSRFSPHRVIAEYDALIAAIA